MASKFIPQSLVKKLADAFEFTTMRMRSDDQKPTVRDWLMDCSDRLYDEAYELANGFRLNFFGDGLWELADAELERRRLEAQRQAKFRFARALNMKDAEKDLRAAGIAA